MRVLLALLLLSFGCRSTGAKLLGPVTVASVIGSAYMVSEAGPPASIENGRIVHHDDNHMEHAAALGVVAAAALFGWFVFETSHRQDRWGGGGSYGGGAWGWHTPHDRGWLLDPADGQHKLYDREGFFVGRVDAEGNIWARDGEHVGRVDTSPGCGIACRRSQARKALLGEDLID